MNEIHIDAQAFLCGQPDVVVRVRGEVVHSMESTERIIPGVTDAVLSRIDTIPYLGDDNTYIAAADHMLKAAADELMAQLQGVIRAFEAFKRMQTSESVH